MELPEPLVKYGPVPVGAVLESMKQQTSDFWTSDRASRVALAGDRPGNAVFLYNDLPGPFMRALIGEAKQGFINVRRYSERPMFAEIQSLIESKIQPLFPTCDVMRVQLAELPPGEVIKPHRDTNILSLVHRLHVPLVTHEKVKFTISGKSFFLSVGELYDLNNVAVHSVENLSDVMRVHLMIDMLPHKLARARYYDSDAAMAAACAPFMQAKTAPMAETAPSRG
jgi:hypothetical protein